MQTKPPRFNNGNVSENFRLLHKEMLTQQTFTCSMSAIEPLEKGVKYVQI